MYLPTRSVSLFALVRTRLWTWKPVCLQEPVVVLEEDPQHPGDGGDDLAVRDIEEECFPHPLAPFFNSLGVARGTEPPGSAGKHQEAFRMALGTADARKPAARIAAIEIALDDLLNDRTEIAIRLLEKLLILRQEAPKMMEQHPVENGAFRMTRAIDSRLNGEISRNSDVAAVSIYSAVALFYLVTSSLRHAEVIHTTRGRSDGLFTGRWSFGIRTDRRYLRAMRPLLAGKYKTHRLADFRRRRSPRPGDRRPDRRIPGHPGFPNRSRPDAEILESLQTQPFYGIERTYICLYVQGIPSANTQCDGLDVAK